MDTQTKAQQSVDDQLAVIRSQMPEVYKSIKAAADKHGSVVYQWVRRALRGEPDLFYAFERGHVVGTPFSDAAVMADLAACMVAFGRCSVCLFNKDMYAKTEGAHGAG